MGGSYIPVSTKVFLNVWGIHRDPQLWDNTRGAHGTGQDGDYKSPVPSHSSKIFFFEDPDPSHRLKISVPSRPKISGRDGTEIGDFGTEKTVPGRNGDRRFFSIYFLQTGQVSSCRNLLLYHLSFLSYVSFKLK